MDKKDFDREVQAHVSRHIRDADEAEARMEKVRQERPVDHLGTPSHSQAHVKQRVKDGDWEANYPIIPNRSVDIYDNQQGGKRRTIHVHEELTNKTIKATDKIKVARVIADMLGVEGAETMSPEIAINTGLRRIKSKHMTPELLGVLRKMLNLATEVGVKVDFTQVPKAVTEAAINSPDQITNATRELHKLPGVKHARVTSRDGTEITYHDGTIQGYRNEDDAYRDAKSRLKEAADALDVVDSARVAKLGGPLDAPFANPEDPDNEEGVENPTEVGNTLDKPKDDDQLRRRKANYVHEETQSHKVIAVVSDPNHPAVSKRRDQIQKKINVSAESQGEALARASRYYRRRGYKVHDVMHHSVNTLTESSSAKTLYVSRNLLNGAEVVQWAKDQGFRTALRPEDMHVTLCYSKKPLVWPTPIETGLTLACQAGSDVREVKQFNQGAVVLKFESKQLIKRNKALLEAGASSDFPDYQSHITITYDPGNIVPKSVRPYAGRLVFGPEIFKEVQTNWESGLIEESIQDEGEEFTDAELDKMADDVDSLDDVLDVYDEDELKIIDQDTGEEVKEDVNEEALNEVLTRSERIRAKVRFLRTSSKRERRLKVVLHTRSSAPVINRRARSLAIKTLKEKIMKKPVGKMSVSEKERMEGMLSKRKALIDRLAMRMAPRIRRIESARLSHAHTKK